MSGTVAQRLGLPQITTQTIHSMFFAFRMYHAVRIGHTGVVLTALETSDFASSHQVALSSSRAALTRLDLCIYIYIYIYIYSERDVYTYIYIYINMCWDSAGDDGIQVNDAPLPLNT